MPNFHFTDVINHLFFCSQLSLTDRHSALKNMRDENALSPLLKLLVFSKTISFIFVNCWISPRTLFQLFHFSCVIPQHREKFMFAGVEGRTIRWRCSGQQHKNWVRVNQSNLTFLRFACYSPSNKIFGYKEDACSNTLNYDASMLDIPVALTAVTFTSFLIHITCFWDSRWVMSVASEFFGLDLLHLWMTLWKFNFQDFS